MPPTPSITVQELSKSFLEERGPLGWLGLGQERRVIPALNRIRLDMAPGEVFGPVGPNGAGKTTLLKILSTLILPEEGVAPIGGFDVVRNLREVSRQLGLMPELEWSFYARLSGRQNLAFFAGPRRSPESRGPGEKR